MEHRTPPRGSTPWWSGRRAALVAWAIIACVLAWYLEHTLRRALRPEGNDLLGFLLPAKALLEGTDPYSAHPSFPYIYPLFFAFALIPLTAVPLRIAALLWYLLSVCSLFGGCWLLARHGARELRAWTWPHVSAAGLLVFLVLASPIQSELRNSQVNSLVLLLCVLFLTAEARRRHLRAGLWLAAAISIKLMPATLLGYLVVRGSWRCLAWTLLGIAILCLLPILVTGPELFTYYEGYARSFLLPNLEGDTRALFFGLHGSLRYVAPDLAAVGGVRLGCLAVTILAVLSAHWAMRRAPAPGREIWPFCVYLIAMPLLSPVAQTHHLLFTVPVVLLVTLKTAFDPGFSGRGPRMAIGGWAICYLVGTKTPEPTPLLFLSLVLLLAITVRAGRASRPLGAPAASGEGTPPGVTGAAPPTDDPAATLD